MTEYKYKVTDLLNYALRQNMYYSKKGVLSFPAEEIGLLKDYVSMCNRYSLKHDKYPQNVEKAHNIASKNIRVLENSTKKNDVFVKAINAYKPLACEKGDYLILVPNSISELVQEGNQLNHCIGSYVDNIVSGKSKIFFLRRKDESKASFVTIELNSRNEFIEAREAYNNLPSEDVLRLIKSWSKACIGK